MVFVCEFPHFSALENCTFPCLKSVTCNAIPSTKFVFICAEKFMQQTNVEMVVTAICFISRFSGHYGDKMSALGFRPAIALLSMRTSDYGKFLFHSLETKLNELSAQWITESSQIYGQLNRPTVILCFVRMPFTNILFNRNGHINSIKRLNIDFSRTIQQKQPNSKLKTYFFCLNCMRDERVPVSVINFAKLGLNCTKIGVLVRIRRYWLRLSIGKMTLWYELLRHGNEISRRKHCNIGCVMFRGDHLPSVSPGV